MQKTNRQNKIAVILSLYDGMRFISEQVQSIISQNLSKSNSDVKLYIRNDQENPSSDTLKLLKQLGTYSNVEVVPSSGINLGVKNSFLSLLNYAEADYYFFSDQDDVWMKNKIERMMCAFKDVENKNNNIPILVYSDVELIDAVGNKMDIQFKDVVRNRFNNGFEHRIFYDNVTGAAMAINRELRDLAIRINSDAFRFVSMHDSAIAQLASLSGEIVFLPDKLIKYRQHENNTIGIGKKRPFKYGLTNLKNKTHHHSSHLKQAQLMISVLKDNELTFNQTEILDEVKKSISKNVLLKFERSVRLTKYAEGILNKIIVFILKIKE